MSSSRQLVSSQICSEDEQTFSRKIVCKAHQDRHDTIIMSNKMAFPTPALLMTSLTDVIAIWWRRWKPPPFIMIIYANMKNLKPPPFPLLPPWEPLFHQVLVQVEQDKDHFVPWVREGSRYQIGWNFGKIPNGLWLPLPSFLENYGANLLEWIRSHLCKEAYAR